MPSRRRRGNLIKKKLHPEIIEIADIALSRNSSYKNAKYGSIQDFISAIYHSTRALSDSDNEKLKRYYHKCKANSFTPPPIGKFIKESEYADMKYVIS